MHVTENWRSNTKRNVKWKKYFKDIKNLHDFLLKCRKYKFIKKKVRLFSFVSRTGEYCQTQPYEQHKRETRACKRRRVGEWRRWWRTSSNRWGRRVSAASSESSSMKATCLSLPFPPHSLQISPTHIRNLKIILLNFSNFIGFVLGIKLWLFSSRVCLLHYLLLFLLIISHCAFSVSLSPEKCNSSVEMRLWFDLTAPHWFNLLISDIIIEGSLIPCADIFFLLWFGISRRCLPDGNLL